MTSEYIEKLKENRFATDETHRALCFEFLEYGKNNKDHYAIGCAYVFLGESYYVEDPDRATTYFSQALDFLKVDNDPEMVARAHNCIGIMKNQKEDYASAISHFLECIAICREHGIYYAAGLSSANLGFLFYSIGAQEKSIEYYELSIDSFSKCENVECSSENIATLKTNISMSLYYLKDYARMHSLIDEMRECKEDIFPQFALPMHEAIYSFAVGDENVMYGYLDEAIKLALEEEEVCDSIDNYQVLCRFLYEQGLYDRLEKLLDVIDAKVSESIFPRIRIELMYYRMECAEQKNDFEGYKKAAKEHARLYQLITDIFHRSIQESLDLQLEIDELRSEEALYKKAADTDNMTQLLNRNGLTKKSNELLDYAKENGTSLATFIIDIDNFKQYNDRYGHVLGDECIKSVANILHQVSLESDCVARFGGDELVMICSECDKSRATEIADDILQKVRDLKIESIDSPVCDYVTVSIGFIANPPRPFDDVTSLINNADKCLYQAKRNGRNQFVTM